MEQVRDFIILHYKLTEREDTEFWKMCKHMDVPEKIKTKMALYASNGRIFRENNELFDETSWLAVMHGQGILPQAYHPMADLVPEHELKQRMDNIQSVISASVKRMPTQQDFIKRYCAAKT